MKNSLIVNSLLLLLVIAAVQAAGVRSNGSKKNNNSTNVASNLIAKSAAYPKKVIPTKKRPTKSPNLSTIAPIPIRKLHKNADVTEAFKSLPADDLEFIKELDKQFKLHGEKIKIKVENDNSTDVKNSKRTVDGDLGYGGYNEHNGYEYNRPKFMFYPYSQSDIPASAPGYYPDISIEPSHSYELKPPPIYEPPQQEQYQQNQQQYHHQHEQQQNIHPHIDLPHAQQANGVGAYHQGGQAAQHQYEEPLIVLRIPGPAKYAAHLKTLLQQYLEIRAAQYLQILEETELRKQQQHQQQQQYAHQEQYEQQQQQQYDQSYHPHPVPQQAIQEQHSYQEEADYGHQIAPPPQPANIDDVYQTYRGRHEQQQQQQHVSQHIAQTQPEEQGYFAITDLQVHQGPSQLHYEQHEPQQFIHPQLQFSGIDHNYQNMYIIAMSPQPIYDGHHPPEQQQPIYVSDEHAATDDGAPSHVISENNPRNTHTKVLFTQNDHHGNGDDYPNYPLPSIRPYERHAPTSTPTYQYEQQQEEHHQYQPQQEQQQQQQQQQQHHHHHQQHQQGDVDLITEYHQDIDHGDADSSEGGSVPITPKPFNYHAHSLKTSKRSARKRGAAITTTTAATTTANAVENTDKNLQKIREYVRDKLGAQMSSSVEFKSTQVVEG